MQSAKKLLAIGLVSLNSLTAHASRVAPPDTTLFYASAAPMILRPQGTSEDLNSGYFANASIEWADKRIGIDAPGYRDKSGRDADGHGSFSRLSIRDYADDLTRPVAVLTRLYNDRYPHNAAPHTICQSVREFVDPADGSSKCQQDPDFLSWMRWLGAELAANPVPAALLGAIIGFEASDDNSGEFPSPVIIPDDLAHLPLPHAFWLFGGGIGVWLGLRRFANKAGKHSIH